MNRYYAVLLALIAVIAAPMILRPAQSARTSEYRAQDRLVIYTPHVETLRYEFERAFASWMQEKHGRTVVIDWRVPGGTSDIIKVVNNSFADLDKGQQDRGIKVDLMFGGGPIDYGGLKKSGYLTAKDPRGDYGPAAVKAAHPDWFSDAAIPAAVAGQEYYDKDLQWLGTCLSAFGICWNKENLQRRGLPAPQTWTDLAAPHFENQLAVSDPTKSGTVAAMFENILQMSLAAAAQEAGQTADTASAEVLEKGWAAGWRTIRRIGANARYWTDSSTKIPLDVSEGEALAGMCVDFYGRNLVERLTRANGESRLGFLAPPGGTTVSPQPIAMFRGAPNPELATRFMEFVISPEGQKIWGLKAGAPGGPVKMALRNMPLRRDFYTPEILAHASDPGLRPLEPGMAFHYEPKYTSDLFNAIRVLIRAMCIDPHHELKEAWHALIAGSMNAEALAAFDAFPPAVSYAAMKNEIAPLLKAKDPIATARLAQKLAEQFRQNYLRAIRLARQ
jgi:iron(III) transport system substrate-binding protein